MKMDGLIRYIEAVEASNHVRIIIKDFVGFLSGNESLFSKLSPFFVHESSYCMMIKEQHHLWDQCLYGIDRMWQKLNRTHQAYYGYCHAGVGEYVVPIMVERYGEKVVIGAVTVGGFYHDSWLKKSASLSEVYRIDLKDLTHHYEKSFSDRTISLTELENKVEIIAEYIGLLCQDSLQEFTTKIRYQYDQNYMVAHVIAYLKNHFEREIKLEKVAEFCHCSPSYISHNFKKLTGHTLKSYINHLRIEKAKHLLGHTHMSVTEIAFMVGYGDGNYFSKVFSDFTDKSPIAYRKEVTNGSNK